MGLSFITEGAIPYAAADPIHVIPSCLVGSAVAGALSALFKCTLMAPHGGSICIRSSRSLAVVYSFIGNRCSSRNAYAWSIEEKRNRRIEKEKILWYQRKLL